MKTRIARSLCAAVVIAFGVGCSSSSDKKPPTGWSNVGGAEIAPDRAFGGKIAVSNGSPYAAFEDFSVGGKLSVMKLSGSSWVNVGTPGFTPDVVGDFMLYVENGTPYVAFSMYDSTGSSNVLNVMVFDGANWVSVGNANFASIGFGTFNLMVSAGIAYIAFADVNSVLHVQALTAGVWADLGGTYPSSAGQYPALTMYNGLPAVAFADSSGSSYNVLTIMTFTGAAWTLLATSTLTLDSSYGADATLTVSGGSLYFVFYDYTYGPVVLKLSGGVLTSVGALGSISNGDNVEYVSGVVYNGVPYVAFDDEARDSDPNPRAATVKYFDGTSWQLYGDYPNSCDIENTYLAADQASGSLYLTYSDCQGAMTVQVH
jgi:hypothetical protein